MLLLAVKILCQLLVLANPFGHYFVESGVIHSVESKPPASEQIGQAHEVQRTRFANKGMGEIKSDDGTVFALTTYQTQDGISLMALHKEFESDVLAKEQFGRELGKAEKVLGRTANKSTKGKVVGERASILIPSLEHGGMLHAVLWTSGSHFNEIISSSLPMALELEKILNH